MNTRSFQEFVNRKCWCSLGYGQGYRISVKHLLKSKNSTCNNIPVFNFCLGENLEIRKHFIQWSYITTLLFTYTLHLWIWILKPYMFYKRFVFQRSRRIKVISQRQRNIFSTKNIRHVKHDFDVIKWSTNFLLALFIPCCKLTYSYMSQ